MRGRASWAVIPAYVGAALIVTWPLAREFRSALPAVFNGVDPLMQAWVLGWDWHCFATGPAGIFNAPIFHPEPRTLTYMDHLIGEALLGWPVAAGLKSLPAAYNALVVFSFAASGWAVYRLARFLRASRGAAFLGGLLYAVAPYRLCNLGNLNQLQTELVPLGVLFGLRFAARVRTRDLVALAATVAVQSYLGWYYTFHLVLALLVLAACAAWLRWPVAAKPPWRRLSVALAGTGLAIAPGAWPYWVQHAAMPAFRRSLGRAALYSADVFDYVRLNRESVFVRSIHYPGSDLAYFVGFLMLALIVVSRSRQPESPPRLPHVRRSFAVIAGIAFVLSLGPILHVLGRRLFVPLPYAVLYFIVPGFSSMRAPGRFAELVLLAAALEAAVGWDGLRARDRNGRTVVAFAATAVLLAWSAPIPLVRFPPRAEMPPVYRWLADQPGSFAILELPMPAREADESERDARRQIWTLYHGKSRADGVSGFSPPAQEAFRLLEQSFPEQDAVKGIADRDVRYVIVRFGEYAPADAARIGAEIRGVRELVPVAQFGNDVVYSLERSEQLARGTP